VEDGASHACMHGSNLGKPHIKIRAQVHITRASALHAPPRRQDLALTPTVTHLSPSGTCEVYRPAAGPFLTIETLHGKARAAAVRRDAYGVALRNEGQETIVGSDSRSVECVADDDLLDYGRHFVATRQIPVEEATRWSTCSWRAKEEATALAAVDVGAFVSGMAARSSAGSLRTGRMPSLRASLQITNGKCLLSLLLTSVLVELTTAPGAHTCTHMVALA
jgi:hypothetical protein